MITYNARTKNLEIPISTLERVSFELIYTLRSIREIAGLPMDHFMQITPSHSHSQTIFTCILVAASVLLVRSFSFFKIIINHSKMIILKVDIAFLKIESKCSVSCLSHAVSREFVSRLSHGGMSICLTALVSRPPNGRARETMRQSRERQILTSHVGVRQKTAKSS